MTHPDRLAERLRGLAERVRAILLVDQPSMWEERRTIADELEALATPVPGAVSDATVERAWQDLIEKDDRTSPAEYPDMALITRDELASFLEAAVQSEAVATEPVAWQHEIDELDTMPPGPQIIFSRSSENPWSHWLKSHRDKCVYKCTPLYTPPPGDSGALREALAEARKLLENSLLDYAPISEKHHKNEVLAFLSRTKKEPSDAG